MSFICSLGLKDLYAVGKCVVSDKTYIYPSLFDSSQCVIIKSLI